MTDWRDIPPRVGTLRMVDGELVREGDILGDPSEYPEVRRPLRIPARVMDASERGTRWPSQ